VGDGRKNAAQEIIFPYHRGGGFVHHLKLFDTPLTLDPRWGVKISYTPDGMHVILSYEATKVA